MLYLLLINHTVLSGVSTHDVIAYLAPWINNKGKIVMTSGCSSTVTSQERNCNTHTGYLDLKTRLGGHYRIFLNKVDFLRSFFPNDHFVSPIRPSCCREKCRILQSREVILLVCRHLQWNPPPRRCVT